MRRRARIVLTVALVTLGSGCVLAQFLAPSPAGMAHELGVMLAIALILLGLGLQSLAMWICFIPRPARCVAVRSVPSLRRRKTSETPWGLSR